MKEYSYQQKRNIAFVNQPIPKEKWDKFEQTFRQAWNQYDQKSDKEEQIKNLGQKLFETLYQDYLFQLNNERMDLYIAQDNKQRILFEFKTVKNTNEMVTKEELNKKALCEILLYFCQQYFNKQQDRIKQLIISNWEEWFIFDATEILRFIKDDKEFRKDFEDFNCGRTTDQTSDYFYKKIAPPFIERIKEQLSFTYCNLKDIYDSYGKRRDDLIALYHYFSPETLLDKPFKNDNNSLDEDFYAELLYIMGLKQVKDGQKKLIKFNYELENSLWKQALSALDDFEELRDEQKREEVALSLVLTWVNRLLFIKLVEAQQLTYHNHDKNYQFLTSKSVDSFRKLNDLFFKVLGQKENRDAGYENVPYLNSSLFEKSQEELKYHVSIQSICNEDITLYQKSVLRKNNAENVPPQIKLLDYIMAFLDAYNFASEKKEDIASDNKTLINASVMGLIFERINGYKDGSFFTPGFITSYMAKEAIDRAVVSKFNEYYKWKVKDIEELQAKLNRYLDNADDLGKALETANSVFNSLKICDPAVGSGHFLVSVLNRMLYLKSYLGLLCDREGKFITKRALKIEIDGDELIMLDENNQQINYRINDGGKPNSEVQRFQEAIFNEKRTIIENCLFGVDINPNSVYICRLRLWIELLKNTYYTRESDYKELETLPNIDINIKCGNSLISKYSVEVGKSILQKGNPEKTADIIKDYKAAVKKYKNENNKENKKEVNKQIERLKGEIHQTAQLDLFDEEHNKRVFADDIYKNSFEWMIEFPELLDNNGKFLGFDVVIGNPPYMTLALGKGQKFFTKEEINKYKKLYPCSVDYKGNTFAIFYDIGLRLLRQDGKLSFITPNSLLSANSYTNTRKLLLETVAIIDMVNFKKSVFESAETGGDLILVVEKNLLKNKNIKTYIVEDFLNFGKNISQFQTNDKSQLSFDNNLNFNFILQEDRKANLLLKLVSQNYVKLGKIVKFYQGIITGNNNEYLSENKKDENWLPIIRGRDFARYTPLENTCYVFFDKKKLWSNTNEANFYIKEKLINRQTGDSLIATYDNSSFLTLDSTHVQILLDDSFSLKFILGVFNSKLLNFIYKCFVQEAGKTFAQVKTVTLKELPIPSAMPEQQKPIIDLVDQILSAKKADPAADTSALEAEIDQLVYKLYALTPEEIAIVEGK